MYKNRSSETEAECSDSGPHILPGGVTGRARQVSAPCHRGSSSTTCVVSTEIACFNIISVDSFHGKGRVGKS